MAESPRATTRRAIVADVCVQIEDPTSNESPSGTVREIGSPIEHGVFAALPETLVATLQTTVATLLQMAAVRVVLLAPNSRDARHLGAPEARSRGEIRFCREAVRACPERTVVSDVRADDRVGVFAAARGGIRFFAALPLATAGRPIGTLCLLDRSVHRLRPAQSAALETCERVVTLLIERHLDLDGASAETPVEISPPLGVSSVEEALASAHDAIAIFESESASFDELDRDRILFANDAFARLYGVTPAELVGARAAQFGGVSDAGFRADLASALGRSLGVVKPRTIVRRDGTRVLVEASFASLPSAPGRYVTVVREFRPQRSVERGISGRDGQHRIIGDRRSPHAVTHDDLTGLPNRGFLMGRLSHLIGDVQQGRRRENQHALLFVDLDRFKRVNDTLGHLFGDALLVEVARRLQTCVRDDDFLSRFAGDEFAVLISSDREPIETIAIRLAERILFALNAQPIVVAGSDVRITASIGVVTIDATVASAEQVLQDADITTYHAKTSGRDRFKVFHRALRERVQASALMETALRTAMLRRQFTLAYQPIVNLALPQPSIEGFEVLLRWNRPGFGRVAAAEFISIAEESGLIVPIGGWVLEQACRQLAIWQHRTSGTALRPSISVNISAQQLATTDLFETVRRVVTQSNVDPRGLALELTESSIIADIDEAIVVFKRIRALGVNIFLDDFGTGYSSLSYLRRLGIDRLKIDRSFVSGMGSVGVRDPEIVDAVVMLARRLGIKATAEGVETEEQLRDLRGFACDSGQGYLFSEPIDAARASALLGIVEAAVSEGAGEIPSEISETA